MDPRQAVLDEIADLSRGDLEAVLAYYTDDVYFEDVTVPQPCRGKAEMRDFMAVFYRGFPDLHIEVRHCVACDGGTVVAEYDLIGTHTGEFLGHPPTGRAVPHPGLLGLRARRRAVHPGDGLLRLGLAVRPARPAGASRLMVSFGISPECLCHDVRDNVARVRDLEEAGFTYIWEGDHTLPWQHSSGHSAGIWATLTAFLANTERAVVGPMVIPPIGIRHQPVDVAVEIATLELLYPGRVALGVGTGEAMNEKTTTGVWPPLRERIERLTEAIELIRRCWEEPDYFRHKGRHFNSFFYLYQKPERRIPIICAAGGPKMAGNAGRLADGYVAVGVPAEVHRDVLLPAFADGRVRGRPADAGGLPDGMGQHVVPPGPGPCARGSPRLWRSADPGGVHVHPGSPGHRAARAARP